MPLLTLCVLILPIIIGASQLPAQVDITPNHWSVLNATLGGRLRKGRPFAAPCFPTINGHHTRIDAGACAEVQAGYTSPTFRSSQFGAYMMPEWETCMSTSEQCLLDSTSPANPAAWADFHCSQGSISPYYLEVDSHMDVQIAFNFSARTGIPLSVKNSGHDYKGRSSMRNSLSLWTRNLLSLTYNPSFLPEGGKNAFRAITMGAGVGWQQVYEFADAHNVTAIGGYSQTVGASGGWLMGGGHSVLSPVYGLGVDRVLQFKIVTPDGVYRTVNAYRDPDLFWALRGGGGSTFGVVLESTILVEPRISLQVASIRFPQTAGNAPRFLEIVVNNALKWGNEGWGGHIGGNNLINVNPRLSLEEAKASVKEVAEYVLSQNGTVVVEELPSWLSFFQKYVLVAEAAVGTPNILGTRLIPTAKFESEQGRHDVYNVLVNMLPLANPYIIVGTPFLFNYTEGSTSVTPAWRNSLWHTSFHASWNFNTSMEEKRTKFRLVSNVTQTMRDIAPNSGAYFNEGDIYEPNHEEAYWGRNYQRLLEVKNKFDPLRLLDCWQCVGWRGARDSRYSCYL